MRIRSVKPEYWQHRMHKKLCVSASLLGAAVLCYADDEGRFEGEGDRIKGMLVPYVRLERGIDELLRELEGVGFLTLYVVVMDGVEVLVGQVLAFDLHQVIQRATPSMLPCPPAPWRWQVVIPETTGKDGKKVRAKGRWWRPVDDSMSGAMSNTSTVAGGVADGDGECENRVVDEVADASLGKGRKGEEVGRNEGESRARARDLPSRPQGEGSLSSVSDGSDLAEEPTVEDVVRFVEGRDVMPPPCGIDVDWARDWHGWMKNGRRFVVNGRLIRWREECARFWGKQGEAWKLKKAGPPSREASEGNSLRPAWARRKELEEAIAGHPANKKSANYRPGCTEEEKAALRAMEAELEKLKKGGA